MDAEDVADVADPEESSIDLGSDQAEALQTAMNQLHPEHRAVVVMRDVDELSYSEIATVTGCPLGTVKSRLHNAKRMLREIMNGRK